METLTIGTSLEDGKEIKLLADPSEKIGVIGISGSGKSYFVGQMVEQWLMAGKNVAVLDDVGIWWGLRTGKDGDPSAGMPVTIYGGMRADEPIPEPWAAAQRFISGEEYPVVFDVSSLSMEWMHWWTAELIKKLGELGPTNTRPAHLIVEEAAIIAPQSGSLSKYQRDCRAALANYARVYRNFGLGLTAITQRPAAVDKNVLTQCPTLVAMRIAAELDRNTVRDWIASNSAEIKLEEALARLGRLEQGQGLLWSPSWGAQTGFGYASFKSCARSTFHPDPRNLELNRTVELAPRPEHQKPEREPSWGEKLFDRVFGEKL